MDRDREADRPRRETERPSGTEPDARVIPVREDEPDARAIPAREDEPDVVQRTQVNVPRDRIRWGPIWAGLLAALASFLLLSLLALAIGALTVNVGGDVGAVVTTTGWATAIIGLIAFFVGGYVAGATSAIRGTVAGLLNGFIVWALGTVLILVFSALGVGQLFGAVGNLFTQFRALLFVTTLGDPRIFQQIADTIASTAFIAFLSMLLPALAATIGGWLGAKSSS